MKNKIYIIQYITIKQKYITPRAPYLLQDKKLRRYQNPKFCKSLISNFNKLIQMEELVFS